MKRRFTTQNVEIMRAIQACSSDSDVFLDANCLLPMVDAYNLDKDSMRMEATLARRSLKGKDMDSISDVIRELYLLEDAFPTLLKLLQICLTIPVSTAECERSFSAMKRIKTYLRTTMSDERLSDLAILSIEKEISSKLVIDDIIDKFASIRKILLQ